MGDPTEVLTPLKSDEPIDLTHTASLIGAACTCQYPARAHRR
jgi:hypothetical protein